VWLYRKNKIDQALSFLLAQTTDRWIIVDKEDKDTGLTHSVPPATVLETVRAFIHQRKIITSIMAGLPSITVSYERLCEERQATMDLVFDFMEVDRITVEDPCVQKTYKRPTSEVVENYDEIVRYVRSGLGGDA
jgi:LPS sulfotransferase NodH